jgi:hypothetical protein
MKNIKIEIKWAVIFSIVALLWMVLEKLTGLHSTHIDKHMYLTNLFAIPAIIVMVLALKAKKKDFYAGQMTYMQGLKSGIILSIFIAVLSPLTQVITSMVITPEYFPNVIAYALETGYFTSISEAEAYFNLENYIVQSTIGALIMGVITTAIAMIFIRTSPAK